MGRDPPNYGQANFDRDSRQIVALARLRRFCVKGCHVYWAETLFVREKLTTLTEQWRKGEVWHRWQHINRTQSLTASLYYMTIAEFSEVKKKMQQWLSRSKLKINVVNNIIIYVLLLHSSFPVKKCPKMTSTPCNLLPENVHALFKEKYRYTCTPEFTVCHCCYDTSLYIYHPLTP